MIFGENLLALLVLALGSALAVGNLLALVRPAPPAPRSDDEVLLERPPLARTLLMIGFGVIAAIWALASLITADDDPVDPAAMNSEIPATVVRG